MKKIAVIAGVALLIILAAQCKKKQDVAADKAAVEHIVVNDKTWFDSNTSTDSTFVMGGLAPSDTALIWWRGVQTHDTAAIGITVVGDSAHVDWTRHNFGDLNLLIKVPDTTLQLWVKKVFETTRIGGIFTRTGTSDDSNRGWSLKRISLAAGVSDSTHTVTIDSMRIHSETTTDMLISDPLHTFFSLDSLPRFTSGEVVTITLYTNATDGNAFLHTFAPWYVRVPFTDAGNGVFTGTWHAQLMEIPRFAIFDVMDYRTLYTPTYGYDFAGWQFPYRIENQ
jgi:hypothetical protein